MCARAPEIANDFGLERLGVAKPLEGLRVACYYGCVLTRPRDEFDSTEKPQVMDNLMQALGAEPVPFPYKAKCCGGAVLLSHPPSPLASRARCRCLPRRRVQTTWPSPAECATLPSIFTNPGSRARWGHDLACQYSTSPGCEAGTGH